MDHVVLAVPLKDKELYSYATKEKVGWYAYDGEENDLISRYYKAAQAYNANAIVRITSDCPLILPEVIDKVVKAHFYYDYQYTYNRCDGSENGWPDGLDVEVFSFNALQRAYVLAKEREHMTFIKKCSTNYIVRPDRDYGPCTSINTQADYEKAIKILGGRHNGGTSIR